MLSDLEIELLEAFRLALKMSQKNDSVIRLRDGYYARVGEKLYGAYACREYAEAAIPVEQRRQRELALKHIHTTPWTPRG